MKFSLFYIFVFMLMFVSCKEEKKYHDTKVQSTITSEAKSKELSKFQSVEAFQKKINEEFTNPNKSPLTKEDFMGFESLDFFPIDTTFSVTAILERTPNAQSFLMPTTTADFSQEVLYGIIHFELDGQSFQLNVYQNTQLRNTEAYKDYLFLPFADKTNGETTYGGGRYIDLRIPKNDTIIVDFNKAYNPYCAYNKKYSCPIVPKENTLDYAITVGVKKFKK